MRQTIKRALTVVALTAGVMAFASPAQASTFEVPSLPGVTIDKGDIPVPCETQGGSTVCDVPFDIPEPCDSAKNECWLCAGGVFEIQRICLASPIPPPSG